jgi:hypothetical protein
MPDLVVHASDLRPPDETAGLGLLDPVTSSPADFQAALEEIGAGRAEYLEVHGPELAEDLPPGVRAEAEMTNAYLGDQPLVLPRPTDIPVSILVRGSMCPPKTSMPEAPPDRCRS